MSWSAIDESEVLEEFNPSEQTIIEGLQGSVDNLPPILARTVNRVRGCVIAGGWRLDQPGTVPDQLRQEVIAIARWLWLISLPEVNETLQSNARKAAHDDAVKRLDLVATGKIPIELPANPLDQAAPANAIEVAPGTEPRVATRTNLDGLG